MSQNPAPAAAPVASKLSPVKITLFGMVMLNVTAVVGLNGLAAQAEYGLGSVFYFVFAAVLFLVPMSLVAAELATGWPERGGIFRWVGEAWGERLGLIAVMLLIIEVTVGFPAGLTFAAVSIAYAGPSDSLDAALGNDKLYVVIVVVAFFWLAALVSMGGVKIFQRVAKWGGILGTFIPAGILIVLGFAYIMFGNKSAAPMEWGDLIPDFGNFGNIVLAASVFLLYAGMEMNAIHVKDMNNAKRNYPLAILISSVLTVLIFVLGTLAVAFMVPQKDISLTEGVLTAYIDMFAWAGIPWAAHIVGPMLAIAIFTGAIAWLAGPSSALVQVASRGYLPKFWQNINRKGMATRILLLQATLVSGLAVILVVVPSVQAFYQVMEQLQNILYLIIYLMMFSAVIILRYTQPNRPRSFKIPGGKVGVWIIGGAGFLSSLIAFVFSFFPPGQIPVGSPVIWIGLLVGLTALTLFLCWALFNARKPSWVDRQQAIGVAPFTWQIEGRRPMQRTTSSAPTEEISDAWAAKYAAADDPTLVNPEHPRHRWHDHATDAAAQPATASAPTTATATATAAAPAAPAATPTAAAPPASAPPAAAPKPDDPTPPTP